MQRNSLFPLIVTDKLAETRAFYVDVVGCELVHDGPEYVQVRLPSGDELSFMTRTGAPPWGKLPAFSGAGLILSIFVPDPDAHREELAGRGAKIVDEPSDKPWGLRSYLTVDPTGLRLDFFRPIEQPKAAAG